MENDKKEEAIAVLDKGRALSPEFAEKSNDLYEKLMEKPVTVS